MSRPKNIIEPYALSYESPFLLLIQPQLHPNSTQPKPNLNSPSTQLQLNLNLTSLQPQPQSQPQPQPQLIMAVT